MTRDGLVEKNLNDQTTVRVSSRTGDLKLERKEKSGRKESLRAVHLARDEPVAGQKIRSRHRTETREKPQRKEKNGSRLRTDEKSAGEGKLKEKEERILAESRGDSRKATTGGTTRPKQKKRLQFAEKETEKSPKQHSNRQKVLTQETQQGIKRKKLLFEEEKNVTEKISGKKRVPAGGSTDVVLRSAALTARQKLSETEDENAAVEGARHLELNAERVARLRQKSVRAVRNRRTVRNRRMEKRRDKAQVTLLYREALEKDEKLKSSSILKKQIQKQRIKREYAKVKRTEQSMGTATVGTIDYIKKIGGKVTDFFKENRKVFISIGVLMALMLLIMSSFTSCASMFLQNVVNYAGAGYMSTDQAIRDADLYYTQLEANLQERINQMETSNPGYDRYRYNVDEIGHDPFILISYLSAKYEVFEFDSQVKSDLDALFAAQYGLTSESSTETITEKKMVRVGESLGQVVTSGYCPCAICCGIWAGGPTAGGVYPQSKHTIAVDAYTPKLPLGTKVVMNGVEYTVEDTGDFTRYGVDFDVYYDTHAEAEAHGHQTWEAYLADDNGSNQVEVVTTSTESVYSVTLTNRSLTGICQNRLNTQQKALFSAYNETKGNLQMFESPLDFNWHYRISSYYGYRIHPISGANAMHNGIDISASEGTSVEAGLTGIVKISGYNSGYGNYVVLTDEDGYEITYAHLSSRSVSAGEQIEKGTEIGKVGSTGNSTGPHLHLELSHNGERLNPVFYFETGDSMPNGNVEYSSEAAKRLVEFSLQFQGVPYVWGGYSPAGFDCSGFVSY